MATYSDNVKFNSEQLMAQVRVLENVRDMMISSKDKYVEYLETNLRPNWTTEGGRAAADRLRNFAETDIQDFITFLNQKLEGLTTSQATTVQIDAA